MKAYGGLEVHIHVFLTSAVVEGEWSASRPGRSTPSTRWIGGGVGSRARTPTLGRPLLRQSLYRLRYPTLRKLELKLLHVRAEVLSAVVVKSSVVWV
jgi:hypothetical protein